MTLTPEQIKEAEARIKLAAAMGWGMTVDTDPEQPLMTEPGKPNDGMMECPNPFTDANDDYAVLEWAISNVQEGRWTIKQWDAFKDYWREVTADWNVWNYRIGDYARAALKVIDDE